MTTDARRRWEDEQEQEAERSERSYQQWLAYHDAGNLIHFEGEARNGEAVRQRLAAGGVPAEDIERYAAD